MKSVVEKVKYQKIDKYYFRNPKRRIKNIYNFAEERTVKLNLLIVLKTLNPSIVLNIKKKTWLMLKEDINYAQNVNLLIKQNVLQKMQIYNSKI